MKKYLGVTMFILLVFLLAFAVAMPQNPPDNNYPVPKDLTVWGGLSLALIFNRGIVPLLYFLGVIKDDNKKLIGIVLLSLGAVAGAVYSLLTLNLNEPLQILTNIVSGALSGLLAVGGQSAVKNSFEYFKNKKA